jgi:hypothetical protein
VVEENGGWWFYPQGGGDPIPLPSDVAEEAVVE